MYSQVIQPTSSPPHLHYHPHSLIRRSSPPHSIHPTIPHSPSWLSLRVDSTCTNSLRTVPYPPNHPTMTTPTSAPKKPRRNKVPQVPTSYPDNQVTIQEDAPIASTSADAGMNDGMLNVGGGAGWYQNATIHEIFEDLSRFVVVFLS
jgi:hypothetical protein